jgi:hypothetical protein
MDRQLIEYYPEWLQNYKEIKVLVGIEQDQAEKLWQAVDSIWGNNFIESLDEYGCTRWETMLGIKNRDTYTLDDRRNNIAVRIAEQRPFTWKAFQNMLTAICGEGGYTVTRNVSNHVVTIKVMLTSKNMLNDVKDLAERIIPANMSYDVDLMYNVYGFLRNYTHAQLSAYTHQQLREEVFD